MKVKVDTEGRNLQSRFPGRVWVINCCVLCGMLIEGLRVLFHRLGHITPTRSRPIRTRFVPPLTVPFVHRHHHQRDALNQIKLIRTVHAFVSPIARLRPPITRLALAKDDAATRQPRRGRYGY